jgi:hypothetical protein
VAVLVLLLLAEVAAARWPDPVRRIGMPLSWVAFGFLLVGRVQNELSATDVSTVRPLGAFLTACAMVVLAFTAGRRRDVFARLGLLIAATGLAVTAGSVDVVVPAVAVGLAAGAALVALERTLLTAAATAAQSRQPPPPLARTRLIAAPLAVAIALAVVVSGNAALPKHLPHTTVGGPSGFEQASGGESSAQVGLDPASSLMDLRLRGSLSAAPVARIMPFNGDREPHLWRAAVMDGYDGTSWHLADNPEPVAYSGAELVEQVNPLGSNALPLLTPGTPTRLVLSNATQNDPTFPETVEGSWYEVTSVVPAATAAQLAAVPRAATPDEKTVAVPTVPSRVLALSREVTAQATTRRQAVDAVVSYLHSHETYRLDSPVPAKGTDAVDDFLFHSHQGFCEQFASAAAVLLQAAGVPTRVITGYASGQQQQDGSWLLRASDAHAWVEVEYPGVGWLPVDPTAGVRLAATGSGWHWRPLALGAAVLLVAGFAIAVIGVVRRRRALRDDPLRRSLAMLDAALGSARRRPTESLRDLAARLTLAPVEKAALGTAERAFYGAAPVATGDIQAAAAIMRRTARRVRRERILPRRRRSG